MVSNVIGRRKIKKIEGLLILSSKTVRRVCKIGRSPVFVDTSCSVCSTENRVNPFHVRPPDCRGASIGSVR